MSTVRGLMIELVVDRDSLLDLEYGAQERGFRILMELREAIQPPSIPEVVWLLDETRNWASFAIAVYGVIQAARNRRGGRMSSTVKGPDGTAIDLANVSKDVAVDVIRETIREADQRF